jgi:TP901 family phage tail tape measure protein
MADVNANIGINIDSSNALTQLKALQRQISQFHTSISRSSEAAALAQRGLQKNLLNSINSIGAFSAEMRTVKTSAESFTNSLEKNKFSMREYFRYAGASTKTFGRLFKSEFDTIGKVSEERVKTLQTQYIKMGRNVNGVMEAIAIRPTSLNMQDYGTKTAIAAQKQALFNQLMKQGSTNLLNFGKNTQWAGRQLMVGFTLPLMAVGTAAAKAFMDMEAQAIRFKKVYGDLFTPQEETQAALDNITELGKQFTKYGVAVSTTVGLAAEAAAAGFQGLDLQRQTTEATRLSILGQVDSQKALETTISLQNAFGMSSEKLAESIDFLNAVENQTVVSLDDITTAIPKVAPVIQQLGGDVKDLTFFMAAMKEGGINASEGANALKSGLAALINPTTKASAMLASFGINADAIVEKNKGNLKATVLEFATALNQLDPLNRARAIEQMFGKFQFARLSTLFANVAKDGNQAARVLDLANSSVEDLASLSEKELGMTAESSMNKFKKSVEDLKVALVPVGQAFLEAATPIVKFVGNILEKFANLSSGTKRLITLLTIGIGAIGPVLLMTFGLLANGVANIIKLFLTLRGGYQRLTGQSQMLAEQTQYMTMEQLDAAAAAHSLNQTHANLTQTFTAEVTQINKLIAAYNSAAGAARNFSMNNPGMMMPGRIAKKFAQGGMISGPGGPTSDSIPVMASNGEAIISAKTVKKYPGIIDGLISGNIPGFKRTGIVGRTIGTAVDVPGGFAAAHFGGSNEATGAQLIEISKEATQSVQNAILQMVNSFDDGMQKRFTAFTNEVIGTSTELNRAVGKQGSGKKALTSLAKRDLVERGEFRDIELQRQLTNAGTSVEEFKVINKKITEEIKIGFDKLGDITEVTAEDLDKLVSDAYNKVAETDKRVKDAQTKMRKVSVVTDPRNDSRIAVGKDPYIKSRKSGKYFGGMQQMAGSSSLPYEKNARFTITKDMAQGLGKTTQEAAIIYNKFSDETKRRLAGLRTDLNAFTKEFTIEAAKVGSKVGAAAVNATATAAGTASPSRKTRKTGEDIGRGLEEGMKSRQDDVALIGSQLGKAATGGVKGGVGPIPFRGPGQPGLVAANAPSPGVSLADVTAKARMNRETLLSIQQQKRMSVMNQRMDRLNKGFMSGTFALSALSGVASMAGGNLGKFSEILFQITGPLFALSSIIQLLTGNKIVSIISKFKGAFGLASIALTAGIIAIKLSNSAREKERMAIEGLANAITTTKTKLETLGEFFGVTPTARAGTDAVLSSIQAKPNERSQIQALKKTESFQKDFEKDISALSKATNEEALLALQTLALDLRGQGFAKAQVDIIIKALLEEADKSKLILKFGQLDLSKEEGRVGAIALAQDITKNFNAEFEKGIEKTREILSVRGGVTSYGPEIIKLTNEQQKQLKLGSQELSNVLAGVSGQFKAGAMSGSEYTDTILKILKPTEDTAYANLLLKETLISINPEYAKATAGVKDYETRLLLVRAALLGVAVAEELVLTTINGSVYEQESARAKIRKMLEQTEKDINNQNKITAAATQTGKAELKGLAAKIKALKDQTKAFTTLIGKQIDFKTAIELTNDAEIVKEILDINAIKNTTKRNKALKEFINLTQKYIKVNQENQDTVADPRDKEIARLDNLQKIIALNEYLIDLRTAPEIKAFNDEIENQEGLLQNVNDEIDKINNNRIKPIQKIIDANNFVLEQISLQEDAINEKYEKQISALEKIETINQDIANTQKQRLSIADALTRGDISAAAQLVQEAKAQQAQNAFSRQKDALTSNRDNQIAALGRNAIEKQNKQLQLDISTIEREKLLTLQEQKQTIENKIEATNRELKVLNTKVEKEKDSATYAGTTRSEIDKTKTLLELSKGPLDANAAAIAASATSAKNLANELERALKATLAMQNKTNIPGSTGNNEANTKPTGFFTTTGAGGVKITTPWDTGAGKSINRSLGGIVPKYMARGGRIGSDTVPAMLTPGEFVMNKKATQRFGPMLSMLNESKYPSMIGNGSSAQVPVNNISTSMNDNSTAVYNYSLGFNINGNNLNANDVARAVMKEIKNVDSQRVRGQRI